MITKEFFLDLANGKLKTPFKNYVIQLKINQLILDYRNGFITLDRAVSELNNLYQKYKIIFDKENIKFTSKKIERRAYTFDEVVKFINEGRILSLAADESLLEKLPKGKWIAGTIPYLMDVNGGKFTKDLIFVDDLTDYAVDYKILNYNVTNIHSIAEDAFDNGFSVIIIPFDSDVFKEFAINSLRYSKIFERPIIGFISGVEFSKIGIDTPKTFNGTKLGVNNEAVVIHVKLPSNKIANIEIINPNSIDFNSPKIIFPKTSFVQRECLVNGKEMLFYDFFESIKKPVIDSLDKEKFGDDLNVFETTKDVIVADYDGAVINRNIKFKDPETKEVHFFAPVFKDVEYRLVARLDDYYKHFTTILQSVQKEQIAFATACLNHYFLANLEGRVVNITGPFSFGEIGYKLLNETLVYLRVYDI